MFWVENNGCGGVWEWKMVNILNGVVCYFQFLSFFFYLFYPPVLDRLKLIAKSQFTSLLLLWLWLLRLISAASTASASVPTRWASSTACPSINSSRHPAHKLHHHSHRVPCSSTTSEAHPSSGHSPNVFAFLLHRELASLKQWLIQKFGFYCTLFVSEFNVGNPI